MKTLDRDSITTAVSVFIFADSYFFMEINPDFPEFS